MISSQELFTIAESCKIEETRNNFPTEQISNLNDMIIQLCTQSGQDANEQKIQLARIIGNLCYNNDSNRDRICAAGIIPSFLNLFETETNADVLRILWSAALNLSMENEVVQNEMLKNGMDHYIERDMPIMGCLTLQVLGNMVESDLGIKEFFKSSLPQALANLLTGFAIGDEEAVDVMEAASIVIETMVEHRHEVILARSVIFDAMLVFVETDHQILHDDYYECKELLLKQLTLITMNDELLIEFRNNDSLIKRFILYMNQSNSNIRETTLNDFHMSGALCVGNLARSDENCEYLMKNYNIGKHLLQLVPSHSVKVAHAALGALKNLSLCSTCKPVLGELGAIETVVSICAREQASALHLGIIGIIKNLCTDNDDNCHKVLSPMNGEREPIDKIVKLVWRDSKENDGSVRNEGGRLIIRLIKFIYNAKAVQYLPRLFELRAITLVLQSLTGAFLTNQDISFGSTENFFDHHVHFDAPPKMTKVFPIVQNESLVALGLLASMEPLTINVLLRYSVSIFPTLLDILKDAPEGDDGYSLETKANALILLRFLISGDDSIPKSVDGLITQLTTLSENVREKTGKVEQQIKSLCESILATC